MSLKLANLRPEDRCAVCRGTSHLGFHFGALTCAACCAFFRRFIENEKSKRYKCRRDSNACTVSEIRQCKTCRFHHCLRAGMNPSQIVLMSDSTLCQLTSSGLARNLVAVAHTFKKIRMQKIDKFRLKLESGASTSDSSFSFEMYKEIVWEERESSQRFISEMRLLEGMSMDDQLILQEEFIKAWLPYMFGVWAALNNGSERRRFYASPKNYLELNVEILTNFLSANFWDVKPYVPFDFSMLGKQFYGIIYHHLHHICPLFRVDDNDVDLGIQALFILLNSGRELSYHGRQIIQSARDQTFLELFQYYHLREMDFHEKVGDLTLFYQIMADSVQLFNDVLATMQVHCGPDRFLYMMPRRIQKQIFDYNRIDERMEDPSESELVPEHC